MERTTLGCESPSVAPASGETEGNITHPPSFDIGDLHVSTATRSATVAGCRVHLTDTEFKMVELLCEKVDKAVTKEMFLERLYGGGDEPELKIVDVYMCKIRKKLRNASGGKQYIDTIWGRGHVLRDPGETEVPTDAQASAS